MSRRLLAVLALLAFAVLSPGCVPVTEPLSDISKAEPDKNLLGAWEGDTTTLMITVPETKGHPKGLMRAGTWKDGRETSSEWFFTTTIGKHSYANTIVPSDDGSFDKDGAFAEWQKEPTKRYFIFRYTIKGDKLVVDGGSGTAVESLMKSEKFEQDDKFYKTPAGWLAKYLDKNNPDTIYDQSNAFKYARAKKK
jgi:hypothetical protein